MPEITVPESARPAIQRLAQMSEESFHAFLDALKQAKPAASPDIFWKHVAANGADIDPTTIRLVVNELFSMVSAIEKVGVPFDVFAKIASDAAFSESSDEFPISEPQKDILRDRLTRLFALKASLGLTAKALDILTDAQRLFFNAKILTDVRPVFNEEGNAIEAAVVVHNLVIHYGDAGDHKNFFVNLDTKDVKILRAVLDRAEDKAKAIRALLQRSDVSYLDIEE